MQGEERKKQILECAKKIFASKGYYQTQISDIQNAAGVARGTIYLYFKNKDDIFATILENMFQEWKSVLYKTPDSDQEIYQSGIKFFEYKIRTSFEFFAGDPDFCNILLKISLGLGENFNSLVSRFDRQINELARNYIKAGIRMNRIKSDADVELLSNLIGGSFTRMAYYYGVSKNDKEPVDISLLSEKFVNAFVHGVFLEEA